MKKVIAILMIAILSLSCFMSVGAAEAEVADDAEVYLQADVGTTYKYVEDSAEFSYVNGKVKFTYQIVNSEDDKDVKDVDLSDKVEIVEQAAATYKEEGYVVAKVTIPELGQAISERIITEAVKKSDNKVTVIETVTAPTCEADGVGNKIEYVLVPGAIVSNNKVNPDDVISASDPVEVVLPKLDHEWEVTKTEIDPKSLNNVKINAAGEAELIDSKVSGSYDVITTSVCKVGGEVKTETETKTIESTVINYEATTIYDAGDIKYIYDEDGNKVEGADLVGQPATVIPSDINKIALKDCKKAGTYKLAYYTFDKPAEVAMIETVKVEAHHITSELIQIKDKADYGLVSPAPDAEGYVTLAPGQELKNLVCNKSIAYKLIDRCEVCNKDVKTTEKTLDASDNHVVNSEVKDLVKNNKDGLDYETDLKDLIDNGATKFVKVSDIEMTYDAKKKECSGTATLTYVCMICGKDVETTSIKIKAHEAEPATPELVTIVAPTCTSEGLANRITKCSVCDTVISVEELTVAKLGHKYDYNNPKMAVTGDTIVGAPLSKSYTRPQVEGQTYPWTIGLDGYQATFGVYAVCTMCGEATETVGVPALKVTAFTPNDTKTGAAGSVTIESTYTVLVNGKEKPVVQENTFKYYDSVVAYLDRHEASEPDPEAPASIELDQDALTLQIGETATLTATVEPAELAVAWSTSNAAVATVSDGKITAVKAGVATITASVKDGEVVATAKVTVQFVDNQDSNRYYYDAVNWAAENDITTGTSDEAFSPDALGTRAQVVTFLYRLAGEPDVATTASFSDVNPNAYYAKAVAWAQENGITTGYAGTNVFGVNDTCTREQFITFLWRFAGKPQASKAATQFTDVKSGAYYADAVAWAAETSITVGTSSTLFGVGQMVNRAMIVTLLSRYAN